MTRVLYKYNTEDQAEPYLSKIELADFEVSPVSTFHALNRLMRMLAPELLLVVVE